MRRKLAETDDMMRTAIILLITFVVLGGAFTIYISSQTKTAIDDRASLHAPVPTLTSDPEKATPYNDGEKGVIKQFNNRTGQISSEMRWESFTRHKDGTTTVIKPSMSFNVGNGQRMKIVGETALIDNFNAPAMTTTTTGKQPLGMPDRGTLRHVHIYLYPNWDKNAQPNLILTTDNLAFDNATFRIATAAYTDENGKTIAADQVPVHVTGDYLFDGRGLTVQWNDRDNRLELLEVAHGEQLTILHPGTVFGSGGSTPGASPSPARAAGKPTARAPQPFSSSMLASADPSAAALALPSTRPAKLAKPPQPTYLARFFENVLITQGLETKITADTMDVGFLLKQSPTDATTRPAKGSIAVGKVQPAPSTPISPSRPLADTPAVPSPPAPSVAATQPAPQSVEVPVVIRWNGPLRITPAPFPLDLTPGTSMLTLWGQPVVARHSDLLQLDSTEARAASMVYYTADGSVSLRSSPAAPKVLLTRFDDSIGSVPTMRVVAENLDFIGRNQEAIFSGPGEAHLPAGANTAAGGKTMDASWQQSAKIFFSPAGHGQSTIRRAVLAGDVDISHPQLSLQSQELELRFAPPVIASSHPVAGVADPGNPASPTPATNSANGELRQVSATDSVDCRLTDSAGKKQTIDCQKLDVRMAHGATNVYPRQIFADGDVHAFDAEQELHAGHVELALVPVAPKASPSNVNAAEGATANDQAVGLRSMYANDRVKLHGKSGQLATCDELQVDADNGQVGRVELIAHNGLATVTDQQNVLSGPTIVMNNLTQQDTVIGPGTLHLLPKDSTPSAPGKPPGSPIDVIWSDRAFVDGPADVIDTYGKVLITQTAEDGGIYTARSPHLHIDLENKPTSTTQPAAGRREGQAAVVAAPATQPALVAGPSTDIFKNKQAKSVTLDQGADVRSTLSDAATGALQREMVLKAPTVIYLLGQSPGEQQTLLVPTAGQMLVRDYRTADAGVGGGAAVAAKTGDTGAAQPAAADIHSMKGLTAFSWKKSLTYTAADHRAVMLQDVHVVHQDSDAGDPARLVADRVIAEFLPSGGKPKPSQTASSTTSLSGPMQLKNLYADGNVTVIHSDSKTRTDSKITGTSMEYDPASHWLTIHGNAAQPVVFSDSTGADITQAQTARWNTESWNIDFVNLMARAKTKQGK
jgi:hypothetical protein